LWISEGCGLSVRLSLIRPKKVGHGGLIARQGWSMLGNDHYGCCVWSGAAHETKLWTYEGSNKNTWFRDKDVLADYAQCTGFDPKRPETDTGTDMQKAAAKYRQDTGIRDAYGHTHKILAYLAIKPGDLELHLDAIWLFGAVGIGFLVPESPPWIRTPEDEPWTIVSQFQDSWGTLRPGGQLERGISRRRDMG
jgi:hypothetical protein